MRTWSFDFVGCEWSMTEVEANPLDPTSVLKALDVAFTDPTFPDWKKETTFEMYLTSPKAGVRAVLGYFGRNQEFITVWGPNAENFVKAFISTNEEHDLHDLTSMAKFTVFLFDQVRWGK